MGRRTRPLDEAEHSAVEPETSMEVQLLFDPTDYVLKWPDSQLSKMIKKQPLSKPIQTPQVRKDPYAGMIHVPEVQRRAGAGAAGGPVCFTMPQRWVDIISNKRQMTTNDRMEFEEQVVRLEKSAAAERKRTSVSMQRLKVLGVAVTKPDNVEQLVYQLWLKDRLATGSPNRPWGTPLIAAFFESDDTDEYFIPTSGKHGINADRNQNDAAGRGRNQGSRRGPRACGVGALGFVSNRRQAGSNAKNFDFLPFEMPKLKGVASGPGLRSGRHETQLANQMVEAFPRRVANVQLREMNWALNDIGKEVSEVRRSRMLDFFKTTFQ